MLLYIIEKKISAHLLYINIFQSLILGAALGITDKMEAQPQPPLLIL